MSQPHHHPPLAPERLPPEHAADVPELVARESPEGPIEVHPLGPHDGADLTGRRPPIPLG